MLGWFVQLYSIFFSHRILFKFLLMHHKDSYIVYAIKDHCTCSLGKYCLCSYSDENFFKWDGWKTWSREFLWFLWSVWTWFMLTLRYAGCTAKATIYNAQRQSQFWEKSSLSFTIHGYTWAVMFYHKDTSQRAISVKFVLLGRLLLRLNIQVFGIWALLMHCAIANLILSFICRRIFGGQWKFLLNSLT